MFETVAEQIKHYNQLHLHDQDCIPLVRMSDIEIASRITAKYGCIVTKIDGKSNIATVTDDVSTVKIEKVFVINGNDVTIWE